MREYFTWARTSISNACSSAWQTGKQIASGVSSIYYSETLRSQAQEQAVQVWEGASRVLNPSIITTLIRSEKSRYILWQTTKASVTYLSSVVLYETVIKEGLRYCIPGMAGSYTELAVDLAASLYFMKKSFNMTVDTTAYNMALYKAVNDANQDYDSGEIQPCKDESSFSLQAMFASSLYYSGYVTVGRFVKAIPVVGPAAFSFIYGPWIYGQGVVEYKLSAAGQCLQHRYEELGRNKSFCFGLGVSLFLTWYGLSKTLKGFTGVDNYFSDDALLCLIYPYFIMSALLIDKQLPGKVDRIDLLSDVRETVDRRLQQVTDDVLPSLWNADVDSKWMQMANSIYQMPIVRKALNLIIGEDFQDWRKAVRRPSIKLFFDTYEEPIKSAITRVINVRENPYYGIAMYLPKQFVSKKSKELLATIRHDDSKATIENINRFVNFVYADNPIQLSAPEGLPEKRDDQADRAGQIIGVTRPQSPVVKLPLTRADSLARVQEVMSTPTQERRDVVRQLPPRPSDQDDRASLLLQMKKKM